MSNLDGLDMLGAEVQREREAGGPTLLGRFLTTLREIAVKISRDPRVAMFDAGRKAEAQPAASASPLPAAPDRDVDDTGAESATIH